MFLDSIKSNMIYVLNESRVETPEEKLHLMVFSILTMLDGDAIEMPAFDVIPSPHPGDKEYHRQKGENWWPDKCNLADGELHSRWSNMESKREGDGEGNHDVHTL